MVLRKMFSMDPWGGRILRFVSGLMPVRKLKTSRISFLRRIICALGRFQNHL